MRALANIAPLIYASAYRLSPEISPCDFALAVAPALGLADHILGNQLVDFTILKSGFDQLGAAMLAKGWCGHSKAVKIIFHNR
jgi:hypothetical protein